MSKSVLIVYLLIISILSLVIVLSCTLPVGSDHATFSVNIVVTDTLGNPVPGLRVSAMSNLDIDSQYTYSGRATAIPSSQSVILGDINCNGIPWEMADFIMYQNYFVSGLAAFGTHVEASIAASNTRGLGTTLTVADLMYLRRRVQGIVDNYNQAEPIVTTYSLIGKKVIVSGQDVYCLVIHLEGDHRVNLVEAGYELRRSFDGQKNRTLVTPPINEEDPQPLIVVISSFTKILKIEGATLEGRSVLLSGPMPTFDNNYPNPFVDSTYFYSTLASNVEWVIRISDMIGRHVDSITIEDTIRVYPYYKFYKTLWDASHLRNGLYKWDLTAKGDYDITYYKEGLSVILSTNPARAIIDYTDLSGKVKSRDKTHYPHLFDISLPIRITKNGSYHLISKYKEIVTFVLTDTATGLAQSYDRFIGTGENNIKLTWNQ